MYRYIFSGLILFISNTVTADFRFIHNNHTYDVITTAVTHSEALSDAKSRTIKNTKGYLARIDDATENAAILEKLIANISSGSFANTQSPDGGNGSYIWLGASDAVNEGNWIWEDNNAQFWSGGGEGTTVNGLYSNWGNQLANSHEPDGLQSQNVAAMSLNGWPIGNTFTLGLAGQWNDINANETLYYIVEYDTTEIDTNPIEGNRNHNTYFLLQIASPLTSDASVDYTTRDNTAITGSDYIAQSGTATIKAGDTYAFIGIEVIGDTIPEENKDFMLVISNPQGANFSNGITEIIATRTIIDDDQSNQTPTVNAGSDRSVTLGTTESITGVASDADGTITSHEWKDGNGNLLSSTAVVPLSGLANGTHTLTLTVTDNNGATPSDSVVVTVLETEINQIPIANAGIDKTITVGASEAITGSGSDTDGTISSYAWRDSSNNLLSSTAMVSLNTLSIGSHTLTLTVTDNDGSTGADTVVVTVNAAANQAPTANAGTDKTIIAGSRESITGVGSDSDGTVVSYEWKEGNNSLSSTATVSLSGLSIGTHVLTLTVTDNNGNTGTDTVTVIVGS